MSSKAFTVECLLSFVTDYSLDTILISVFEENKNVYYYTLCVYIIAYEHQTFLFHVEKYPEIDFSSSLHERIAVHSRQIYVVI